MTRRVLLVACVLTLGACGGPKVPLEIGAKTVSVNVEFGKTELVVPPDVAPPPVEVQPLEGGVAVVPSKTTPAPARRDPDKPAADPCPAASAFAFPAKESTNQVDSVAPQGQYDFRASGIAERAGAKTAYPAIVKRTVSAARTNADGTRSFNVSETVFGVTTVTTYVTDATQVAIARIARSDRSGSVAFGLVPALKILPLPPVQNDPAGRTVTTWQSTASDSESGTTITIDGRVIGRDRIDACGQLVDAWTADATQRVVGPNENLTSTLKTWFATQYGGLIVRAHSRTEGTVGGTPFRSEVELIINSVPGS